MEKIRITGIGLVNRAGLQAEAFWQSLCEGAGPKESTGKTEFKPAFPASKLRRVNRYCKMALYAAHQAWKDGELREEIDPFRRGTIFSTGYGAIEAQAKFCREVAKGEPDFCSPTTFTGTVPNSCVGTVCMFLSCKGVSTMLSGGNHLEYASLLLGSGKADVILAGAVEEYFQELYEDLEKLPSAQGVELAEGCAVLALERGTERGYCTLERTAAIGLPCFPILEQGEKAETGAQIEALLRSFADARPDVILSAANGGWFDQAEGAAIARVFPGVPISRPVKAVTGETMGCGFTLHTAAAALCLGHGFVPAGLTLEGEKLPAERIFVSGFDSAGNYLGALLSK